VGIHSNVESNQARSATALRHVSPKWALKTTFVSPESVNWRLAPSADSLRTTWCVVAQETPIPTASVNVLPAVAKVAPRTQGYAGRVLAVIYVALLAPRTMDYAVKMVIATDNA
jgi:hypothetical protein